MNERQQRLKKERDRLQAEWDVRHEKLTRLCLSRASQAAAAIDFQLEKEIEAEEKQLEALTKRIEAIEQELDTSLAVSGVERREDAIDPPQTRSIDPPSSPPAQSRQAQPAASDDLRSEKGIDYTRLRDLLKAGKWKEADYETYEVMIRAVGRELGDYFRSEELLNFPCADLQTIDTLWFNHSGGKFGFRVQKQIYVDCGGKLDGKYPGDKIWNKFCDRVGWRVYGAYVNYSDLKFDPSLSLAGELPFGVRGVCCDCWCCGYLFSRIKTCEL